MTRQDGYRPFVHGIRPAVGDILPLTGAGTPVSDHVVIVGQRQVVIDVVV